MPVCFAGRTGKRRRGAFPVHISGADIDIEQMHLVVRSGDFAGVIDQKRTIGELTGRVFCLRYNGADQNPDFMGFGAFTKPAERFIFLCRPGLGTALGAVRFDHVADFGEHDEISTVCRCLIQ